ncbi:MAG: sulfurtransferase-like selenium metabolism protein YedF [Bacteroidales bacterium]|nr:sulfurtransferase-like selenium metabolism protein YedF [Bacteroidales bacterium]HOY38114.1 sulfurtransferase-like selenium metabolism protein YedF [Bacteroidales bacterium]
MITINARGLACPQPLILAKQALDKAAVGESICISTDSETSMQNLMTFLRDLKAQPVCAKKDDTFFVTAKKSATQTNSSETSCSINSYRSHVVAVTSETMGSGPEDLGRILMKAFINTLNEAENLPSHLVFYNSGVLLTHCESDVLGSLKALENKGVYIHICGTCADYFQIRDKIGIGQVSNMYTIVEVLSKATSIIRP